MGGGGWAKNMLRNPLNAVKEKKSLQALVFIDPLHKWGNKRVGPLEGDIVKQMSCSASTRIVGLKLSQRSSADKKIK